MEYLLFNPKHFNNLNYSVKIDSHIIWPNELAKNLGAIFQSIMLMDKCISAIVKPCFPQLSNFHRIHSVIFKTAVITLSNALVHSHLEYK